MKNDNYTNGSQIVPVNLTLVQARALRLALAEYIRGLEFASDSRSWAKIEFYSRLRRQLGQAIANQTFTDYESPY